MAIELKGNIVYNTPYVAPPTPPTPYSCVDEDWTGYQYGWPPNSLGPGGWQYNSGECFAYTADPADFPNPPAMQIGGSGSYLITPLLENVENISFKARSNWNNRHLAIYGSIDGGTNWELITTLGADMAYAANNVSTTGSNYNRIKFLNTDSIMMALDDIVITCLGII